MISSLRGNINRIFGNYIEVDVSGVGYLVYVGNNFLKKHTEGESLKINIYMSVTENDINLYGFDSFEELDLFKMLITVSGVGPKTAAGILAEKGTIEIIKAIGDANVDFFKKIKGIGLKTAQRIIVDLKSKINNQEMDLAAFADGYGEPTDDLVLSLQQLGFEKKEIEMVTKKMPVELIQLEEKLEWCLLNLGR